MTASDATVEPVRRSRALLPLDLLRGFLIGMAELVPGVSGGTVALVTGVYDELIDSASHVIGAARQGVAGRTAAVRTELRLPPPRTEVSSTARTEVRTLATGTAPRVLRTPTP